MKTRETTPGKTYSVHTSSGCTVNDKSGWSKTIDAPDGYFTAHAGEVTIDGDDTADVRELFKLAPQLAILGVLGGNGGLPAGYRRLEYLESTGTQYILKVETLQSAYAEYVSQFNTIAGAATEYKAMYFGFNAASPVMGQTWDGKWVDYGTPADLEKHTFKMRADVLNDTQRHSQIDDMPIKHNSLGSHNGRVGICPFSLPGNPYRARLKNFSTKIWNADELVHELIPALDPTGAPCLYDIVTRTAFYNAGTDDFLYPAERTTYALRRVLPDWGKLTEHGLRRLYHAPANYKGELYDYALENGYKPIIEPEMPADGYWQPQWRETENEIVLDWVETEPPADEFGLPEEDLTNN